MRKVKKFLSVLLIMAMTLTAIPIGPLTAWAAPSDGTFDLATGTWTSGSSSECTLDGFVLTINSNADITLTGVTDRYRVEVAQNAANVNITLDGVTIDKLLPNEAPILLHPGASLTITLADGSLNRLTGGGYRAAIQAPEDTSLTMGGTGSLIATGGINASGIGGGDGQKAGEITITGGDIIATGGEEVIQPMPATTPLVVSAGATAQESEITLEWSTTKANGSFTAELSTTGPDSGFNAFGSIVNAEDEIFDYNATHTPSDESDLYFRVTQTAGEESAVSNIVKMIYIDDVGYVQDADGTDGIGVDMEAAYKNVSITASDNTASVTLSKTVLAEKESVYKNTTLSMIPNKNLLIIKEIKLTPEMGWPSLYEWYSGGNAFEIPTAGTPVDLLYGSKLEYTFAEGAAPVDGNDLKLCFIASMSLMGFTFGFPIPLDFIKSDYDAATRTFTSTLPAPGRYIITNGSPGLPPLSFIPDNTVPTPEPEPDPGWQPTSKLAKIIHDAGFSYDPDADLLFARIDASQRDLGFAYFYDEGIALISSYISCEPIYFIYDDKEWLIEIWKGQYGIELGAEIGVYNRTLDGDLVKDRISKNYKALVNEIIKQVETKYVSIPGPIKDLLDKVTNSMTPAQFEAALQAAFNTAATLAKLDPFGVADFSRDAIGSVLFGLRSKLYDCVPDGEMLKMKYSLNELKLTQLHPSVEEIFNRGPDNHWWLTGFDWGNYTNAPHSLIMDATIYFPNENMRQAFINGYNNFDEFLPFFMKDAITLEGYAFYNNDNAIRMSRGLKGMGYQQLNSIDLNTSDSYTLLTQLQGAYQMLDDTANGYGVRFTVGQPRAIQPFITTQMGSIVSINNKNLVNMYNQLKSITGCPDNDPNKLEECVLNYTGPAKGWVNSCYELLTGEIIKIVDVGYSIAKAAMKPGNRALAASEGHMDIYAQNSLFGLEGIDAAANSGLRGAGIGGGYEYQSSGSIIISGGSIRNSAGGSPFVTEGFATSDGSAPVYLTRTTAWDNQNNRLANALITAGGYNAYTDSNGAAYLWLPADSNYTFSAQKDSYSTQKTGVTINANDNNSVSLFEDNDLPQLTGTAEISGKNKIGETLTVNTQNITDGSGALSYHWQVDGENAGENAHVYVIQGADTGKAITCIITREETNGYVAAEFDDGAVVPYDIRMENNGAQGDDTAVTLSDDVGRDGDAITLEYVLSDVSNANDILTFTGAAGLTNVTATGANSQYYNVNSADAVNGIITIVATFLHTDLEQRTLTFVDSGPITKAYGDAPFANAAQSSAGDGTISYNSSNNDVAAVDASGEVTIQNAGQTTISAEITDDATYASATASYILTVTKAGQDAPAGLNATDETAAGANDGTITGVTTDMEYKLSTSINYTACPDAAIKNLAPGTYYVRYQAKPNYNASGYTSIRIEAYKASAHYYTVTVVNGTGSGSYAPGAAVSISADSKRNYRFNGWTVNSGEVTLANASSATTTFMMPSNNVTVTANWSYAGGTGGNGGSTSTPAPATPETGDNTITTPADLPPLKDANGNSTLPGGGTVETPGGTIDVPPGTTIDQDGNITIPPGRDATVTLPGGTEITLPGGSTITADGHVTVGSGEAIIRHRRVTLHIMEGAKIIFDVDMPLGYIVSSANPFIDVKSGDWFYDNVIFNYIHGLMGGTSADTFSPNAMLTRAMFVTILARLSGADTEGGSTWYAKAVAWASAEGITDGQNMQNPITREQMAAMLQRYTQLPVPAEPAQFADDSSISGYAREAISAMQAAGIITGKPGNMIDPQGFATRAETAAIFNRLIKSII